MDELKELLARTDALLKDIDAWKMPSANGGTDSRIVMAEIETEHGLLEAREALQRLMVAADKEYVRQKAPVRMCQCTDTDNSLCGIHTVGHPYADGCCDQPKDDHRHMTSAEWKIAFPKVFDERVAVGEHVYRVDAHRFRSDVGVTITQLFKDDEDDEDGAGLCFDMSLEALRGILPLLQRVTGDIIA